MNASVQKARAWASSLGGLNGGLQAAKQARQVFGPPYGGASYFGTQGYRFTQVLEGYRHWSFVAINAWIKAIAGGEHPQIGDLLSKGKQTPRSKAWKRKQQCVRKEMLGGPSPNHEFHEYDPDDPIVRLFRRPNDQDVAYDFWAYTVLFYKLCGYCVIWVIRDETGMPRELWPVPTHWIQLLRVGPDQRPEAWQVNSPWGQTISIPWEQTFQLQAHSPLNRYEGYAVSIAIAEWLDTYESLIRVRLAQFKNGAVPNIHVALGESYSDPDEAFLARFYSKWFARFQGENQAGLPLITGPDITVTNLNSLPYQMFDASEDQIKTECLAAFNVPQAIVTGDPTVDTCHDVETECLTAAGWLKYDQLTLDTRVACFDADSGKIVYRKPSRIILADYEGPMHRWKSKVSGMDALMTPAHKVWVQDDKFSRMDGVLHRSGKTDWHKVEVSKLSKQTHTIKTAAEAACARPAAIEIQAVRRGNSQNNTGPRTRPTVHIDPEDWCRFLGWFCSEGYTCVRTNQSGNRLHQTSEFGISQTAQKTAYCEEIDGVMSSLGVKFSKTLTVRDGYSDTWCWKSSDNGIVDHLRKHCGTDAKSKRIPAYVKDWPAEYLEIILRALVKGDGTTYSDDTLALFSSSKQLADDVQELATKCGWRSSITSRMHENRKIGDRPIADSLQYRVNLLVGADERILSPCHRSIEQYNGKVWCLEVPTGLFVTRRNGCTLISSNSAYAPLRTFYRLAVNKELKYFGEKFTEFVVRPTPGYERGLLFWPDQSPDDPQEKLNEWMGMLDRGVVAPNECRTAYGMEPFPHGGDDPYTKDGASIPWFTGRKPETEEVIDQAIRRQLQSSGPGLGGENGAGGGYLIPPEQADDIKQRHGLPKRIKVASLNGNGKH